MVRPRARASIPWVGALLLCSIVGAAPLAAQNAATAVAQQYVERNHQALGLSGSDVGELVVSSASPSSHNGVTHVYLQQRYRGIDVYNGVLTISVRGADVVSVANRFVSNIAAAAGDEPARAKEAAEALDHAEEHLNLPRVAPIYILAEKGGASQATTLADAGVANEPINARLTWVETDAGRVRLAWLVEIEEKGGDHHWQALVDAETGASLGVTDLIVHDSIAGIVSAFGRAESESESDSEAEVEDDLPLFSPTDGAVYRVFPIPFESPNDGDRELVSNAADPVSSPFGWHDTDGAAGPEFFVTRGNNVHAYTDVDANNVPDSGSDPIGGGALQFDFPLDLSQQPATYRPAAVTNLFYWNNLMHDVTYRYGFDEPAGNFQVNNYGHGGLGNDDVRAEAQDGSGTNNANFFTPVDGARPRMQMFVWTHPLPNLVTVHTPAGIAGDYSASRAQFGQQMTLGGFAGTAVVANDGVGATGDACEPLVGFPAGSIAIVDRGTCEFGFKALTAQNAGASGVIVANNAPGAPITMGPGLVGNLVTIPTVMVSQADGDLFKANAPLGVTLRLNPVLSINRDSDLDAGVIAHEYGHGISNRLTGGPATVSCLNNAEQMGEGWSDWFALIMTTHPSDRARTPRGMGSYLIFGADGGGIRPTAYTTDVTVNPSTYASVANVAQISQPHGIGYVWNTMLWEMYWNLVDRHGYNSNVYDAWSTGGNNRAIQFVIDGMKFQPCRPGFVDGRDAILAADTALTGGANRCEIWRAFAKRGLGASANQGLSTSRTDGVEAFDLPAACTSAAFGGFREPWLPGPTINTERAGARIPIRFTLSDPAGGLVVDHQPVDCTTLEPFGETPQIIDPARILREGDKYALTWRTREEWVGSCRRLTLRIPAASDAVAYFQFK